MRRGEHTVQLQVELNKAMAELEGPEQERKIFDLLARRYTTTDPETGEIGPDTERINTVIAFHRGEGEWPWNIQATAQDIRDSMAQENVTVDDAASQLRGLGVHVPLQAVRKAREERPAEPAPTTAAEPAPAPASRLSRVEQRQQRSTTRGQAYRAQSEQEIADLQARIEQAEFAVTAAPPRRRSAAEAQLRRLEAELAELESPSSPGPIMRRR